jgi:predicted ATPase
MEFLVDGHILDAPSALLNKIDSEDTSSGNAVYYSIVSHHGKPCPLIDEGSIRKKRKAGKVAKFTFDELCGQPLGAADYIFLGETFECIFLENIPKMSMHNFNEVIS